MGGIFEPINKQSPPPPPPLPPVSPEMMKRFTQDMPASANIEDRRDANERQGVVKDTIDSAVRRQAESADSRVAMRGVEPIFSKRDRWE